MTTIGEKKEVFSSLTQLSEGDINTWKLFGVSRSPEDAIHVEYDSIIMVECLLCIAAGDPVNASATVPLLKSKVTFLV